MDTDSRTRIGVVQTHTHIFVQDVLYLYGLLMHVQDAYTNAGRLYACTVDV